MSEPAAEPLKALVCPACGAPVTLRAAGYTTLVACESCGSRLDAVSEELKLIERLDGALRTPRIPLGARGVLFDVEWEAIGYLERSSGGGRWSEYLLFNPYRGYRWLIDDSRNWSFGQLLDEPPTGWGGGITFDKRPISRFEDPYPAWVTVVLGEFYWRVAADDKVTVTDFAAPGLMISKEQAEDEVTWTRLDLLPRGAVEAAFGIKAKRLRNKTPSPHEPSPYRELLGPSWGIAFLAVVSLLFACFLLPREEGLGGARLAPPADGPEQTTLVSNLVLPRDHDRVVIQAAGDRLDNEWIDVDLALVDQRTQASFDGYALTEFYSGRDSDGPWSEGETRKKIVFSHVPTGRYDLVVDAAAHLWRPNTAAPAADAWVDANATPAAAPPPPDPPDLYIDVVRGGVSGWNLAAALLAVLIVPAGLTAAEYWFERLRRGLE